MKGALPEFLLCDFISRVQRWMRFEGTGIAASVLDVELEADGKRNGRAPLGEA